MTLTREQGLLAAVVVVGALVWVCVSPWSPLASKASPDGFDDVTWSPSKPFQHKATGGLFHPAVCGRGRTELIRNGWGWISNPPSEQTGPGYA